MLVPGVLVLFLAASGVVSADAGVTMFTYGSLSSFDLAKPCELSLYTSIDCDASVSSLGMYSYGGGLDNITLTDLVCQNTCEASIAQLHDSVASNCGTMAELIPGISFLALVGQLWSNWNQTCFTDPTTGENCNDAIAAFPDVDDITSLPTADLCSYCNVQRLAMLQANAYSDAYNKDWESIYEAVAQACDLTVSDFDPVESAFNVTVPSEEVNCVSGNTYTTKAGDTCDSIAQAFGVSASTMYYINSNIMNCSSIWAGTRLCLPQTCTSIYSVQANDTCSTIAAEYGLFTSDIRSFNSQLNVNCSNLVDPSPYWGSTLCVSTPGGTYSGQPPNNTTDGTSSVVDPPAGSSVATGTTTDCGAWYVNDGSLTCSQICLSNLIAINMLTVANPSLSKEKCDSDLVVGAAYCIDPLPGWDYDTSNSTSTATSTSVGAATTTSTTKTMTSTSTKITTTVSVPGPTQSGIPSNCNEYYVAIAGDTCATVVAKYGITSAQFHAWNPAISADCTTGFWADEAYCVGVSS